MTGTLSSSLHVMLVGGGGREAALAWRLSTSRHLGALWVTHKNPGFPADARRVVGDPVAAAVAEGVDLVIVGPEVPLAEGLADRCARAGVACFGPTAAAARLETSKAWAKGVLADAGVPVARHFVGLSGSAKTQRVLGSWEGAVVLKADGLAAGKGVQVFSDGAAARVGLAEVVARVGEAARVVVLEPRLVGREVSVFALTDGDRVVALPAVRDHKRLRDGDRGPNTGGMGAVAPVLDAAQTDALVAAIHAPVLRVLRARGAPYRGVLYAGLMLTDSGPQVLEFNVRFGDPECQVLMALWDDDPLPWLLGAARGHLPAGRPRFRSGGACCVVLASAGYPGESRLGVSLPPVPLPPAPPRPGAHHKTIFVAGAACQGDGLVSTGGRVLGVTATGRSVSAACAAAYEGALAVRFAGCQVRSDIGRGLP